MSRGGWVGGGGGPGVGGEVVVRVQGWVGRGGRGPGEWVGGVVG